MTGLRRYQVRVINTLNTDEYGFRNPPGTLDQCCDIVVVGDSFAGGANTSDNEIFASQLRDKTQKKVYNYALRPLHKFLADSRFIQKKPKWVILFYVERNLELSSFQFQQSTKAYNPRRFQSVREYRDFIKNERSIEQNIKANLENIKFISRFTGRIFKETFFDWGLWGLPKTIHHIDSESKMIFFRDGIEKKLDIPSAHQEIDNVISALKQYEAVLNDEGIQMLTIIIPDKETLYHDLIPSLKEIEARANIDYFYSQAESNHLQTLPAHDLLFLHKSRNPGQWLFHLDDTHLNGLGFSVIAEGASQLMQATPSDK
jgi:hypothetical protein